MPLLPTTASEDARAALAAAGIKVLAITSQRTGTDYVTTTVRVKVGDADRVLAVLRNLAYGGASAGGGMRYGLVAGWAWRAVRANLIGLPQQDRSPRHSPLRAR